MGHKIYKIHIKNFENMGFRIMLYVNIAGCTMQWSKQRNLKERQNLPNRQEKGTRANVRGVCASLAINSHLQTGGKLGGKSRVWETAKGFERRQFFPPLRSRQCYRVTHGFSAVGMRYFPYSSEHRRSNEKTDYRYRFRLDTAARHIRK